MNNEDEVTVVWYEISPYYVQATQPYWLIKAKAKFSDGSSNEWMFKSSSRIEGYDVAHRLFKVRCLARTALRQMKRHSKN